MHVDDTLKKFKVKLIAKDFSQMFEVDYTNTFAFIAKFDTLRLFLVIVALKDLKCHQVNVNNAFIESFLKEKFYMKFSSRVNLRLDETFLIRRNLYDLKQAIKD